MLRYTSKHFSKGVDSRRIFMLGTAVFTLASLLCAAAPTAAVLVAGRALAALGAALLMPASLAIIRVV